MYRDTTPLVADKHSTAEEKIIPEAHDNTESFHNKEAPRSLVVWVIFQLTDYVGVLLINSVVANISLFRGTNYKGHIVVYNLF